MLNSVTLGDFGHRVHNPAALEVFGTQVGAWLDREVNPERPSVSGDSLCTTLQELAGGPNTVVFVAKKAYFNQLRTSVALRRLGWKTIAVVLDPSMRAHNEGFFDHVVTTDLGRLLQWWSQASNVIIHTQGWLFRYHIPVLLEAFKPTSCTQIVEIMDLNSFMFPPENLDDTLPYMKIVWGDDCEYNHRVQLACQQYIFEHADGVIFPGDKGHQIALGLQGQRPGRYLNFMSYPLSDFFADASPRSTGRSALDRNLVFAGGVPTSGPRRTPAVFADAQLLSCVDIIAKLGFSLDVYNNPLIAPIDSYEVNYPGQLALARKYPNFRFLAGGMPWEIIPTLATYDYGLMLYDCTGVVVGENHFRHLVPTKLFLYVEAGIPVLVSDRWRAVVDIVEHYDIGVSVSADDLAHLPAVIERLDHSKLRHNVRRAREALSMDRQISRLVELYELARGDSEGGHVR